MDSRCFGFGACELALTRIGHAILIAGPRPGMDWAIAAGDWLVGIIRDRSIAIPFVSSSSAQRDFRDPAAIIRL
jgi:hypothetical protein